jgi:hypothetical protein
LVQFVQKQGVKLSYSEDIAPAKGISNGGRITLLTNMEPAEGIHYAGSRIRPRDVASGRPSHAYHKDCM